MMFLEVNPDSVRAGWVPLLIVIGVGVVLALLGWSMLHEIKKVQVPTRAEIEAQEAQESATDHAADAVADVATVPTPVEASHPVSDSK